MPIFSMILINIIFAPLIGVVWFLLSKLGSHELAGIFIFLFWIGLAIGNLRVSEDQQGVKGSGAFEMLAANTLQVLGITIDGFRGGIIGFILYLIFFEIFAYFRFRLIQTRSFFRAILHFFLTNIIDLIKIAILCYTYVFVVSLKFPNLLNFGRGFTLMNYICLCLSYFLWIGFGVGIIETIKAQQKRPPFWHG